MTAGDFGWLGKAAFGVAVLVALSACGQGEQTNIPPAAEQSVQVAGRTLKPGDTFRDCEQCPEMVVIPAGRYSMGTSGADPKRSPDEAPQHQVTIAKPFAVGRFEVTRGEYAAFVAATGTAPGAGCRKFNGTDMVADAALAWDKPGFEQSDKDPLVCVDWEETRAYLQWLGLRTGVEYRLLSEAE